MRELPKSETEFTTGGITVSSGGPGTVPYAPWGPTGSLTATNYTPPFANINFSSIISNEGASSTIFYLLTNNSNDAYSGYTVGAGIDFSQMSEQQINSMFGNILTPGQLAVADQYSATALRANNVAPNETNAWLHNSGLPALSLTPQQTYEINLTVYNLTFNTLASEYYSATGNAYASLPSAAATVGADLAINIGPNWLQDKNPLVMQAAKDFEAGNWNAFANDLLQLPYNKSRMEADANLIFGSIGAPYVSTSGSTGGTSLNSMPSYWNNYDPTWYGWWDYEWVQPQINGQNAGPPVLVPIQG